MAKPRVFISSTYYDLKHLRSAFESFLEQFNFEPVLSEKGNIAYAPDIPLDESCYREVDQVDIFILIIGGRYGSEKTFGDNKKERSAKKEFYDRYDSITREEFRASVKKGIPTYILIERAVYDEYHTFTKNRNSTDINYAHVDSINIFKLIDEVISLPKNNPIFSFDRYHEIEEWLREQWSSLFKELLQRNAEHHQLSSMSEQVSQLTETNKTLRKYIELIMSHVAPDSKKLITSEDKRLKNVRSFQKIANNDFVQYFTGKNIPLETVGAEITHAKSIKSLMKSLSEYIDDRGDSNDKAFIEEVIQKKQNYVKRDINEARNDLGLKPLRW